MKKLIKVDQFIHVSAENQTMTCYIQDKLWKSYSISTGKNGLGEKIGSECTPRGWHCIHSKIGMEAPINSVFVGRIWTGEIYSPNLAAHYPDRDWILTRILRLEGLEPGRNKGGEVDSFQRYIYIHGSPDTISLGIPGSRGCIRMHNKDMVELANWVTIDTPIYIH